MDCSSPLRLFPTPGWPAHRVDPSPLSWHYKNLVDIEVLTSSAGTCARLICEEDEGGLMFTLDCPAIYFPFLEPYSDLLKSWRACPSDHENPVIPVAHSEFGPYFSISGACHDFPEILDALRVIPLLPRLTAFPAVLSRVLLDISRLG